MLIINNSNLKTPTQEYILSKISDYEIFRFYIPGFKVNKNISSPLRDDKYPSFSLFYSERHEKILFYDHSTKEKGDCFVFVSKLYNLNYFQSLCKICVDFGISDGVYIPGDFKPTKGYKNKFDKPLDNPIRKKKIEITVKTKSFSKDELQWWSEFGINQETLKKYNVFSLSKVFINSLPIVVKFSFGYLEYKDNKYSWKIYSPLNPKNKWVNNADKSVIQGFSQLPESGDKLIITKSLKDTMSIVESNNIPSCSLQSESGDIKYSVMKDLKSRFKNIFLLLDNDSTGLKYGKELSDKHKITPIFIPNKKWKDYSDMYKNTGKTYAVKILNKIIKNRNNEYY